MAHIQHNDTNPGDVYLQHETICMNVVAKWTLFFFFTAESREDIFFLVPQGENMCVFWNVRNACVCLSLYLSVCL